MSAKKSAKSILEGTKTLSDLITRSPSMSMTKIMIWVTLLLGDADLQNLKHPGYIFSKDVAILLFVEAIEYFSVLLDKFRTDFWFEFNWNLLLSFRRLHSLM